MVCSYPPCFIFCCHFILIFQPQISQDAKGGKWQAEQVVVANVDGGYSSTFDVKDWFDPSRTQGSYFRWTSDIAYKVTVYTSKGQAGSGYDGDVFLVLTGMYGATDEEELINSSDPAFLPDGPETFMINARDVGALSKVSLPAGQSRGCSSCEALPSDTRSSCLTNNPPLLYHL